MSWLIQKDIINETRLTKKLLMIFFIGLDVMEIFTIITMLFSQDKFISAFEKIKYVDNILKNWGTEISYNKEYFTVYTLTCIIPFLGILANIGVSIKTEHTLQRLLCESICFGLSMVVRTYVFLYLSFSFDILKRQFKNVNELLIRNGCEESRIFDDDQIYNTYTSYKMLKVALKMHEILCYAVKDTNKCFQRSFLLNIFITFVLVIFDVHGFFRDTTNTVSAWEYTMYTMFLCIPLLIVINKAQQLKHEVR